MLTGDGWRPYYTRNGSFLFAAGRRDIRIKKADQIFSLCILILIFLFKKREIMFLFKM